MITRRATGVGLVIVALYLMTAIATMRATGHHVRPLFEGVGPSTRYQWVHPPPDFAAGNIAPRENRNDLSLTPGGSAATGVSSSEAQFVVNLSQGAVVSHAGDTRATATITPLDPARLGPPPAGLQADGNAYRIAINYQPSGQAVLTLATAGNVIMQVPAAADTMLFSTDGTTWQRLAAQPVGSSADIGATFTQPGYYLAAGRTATPAGPRPTHNGSNTGRIVLVAVLTVALALILGLAPAAVRRARRRQVAAPGRGTSRPRRLPKRRPRT